MTVRDRAMLAVDLHNRYFESSGINVHEWHRIIGRVLKADKTSQTFVPLNVREGGRRAKLRWWWGTQKERFALWLCPWLDPWMGTTDEETEDGE